MKEFKTVFVLLILSGFNSCNGEESLCDTYDIEFVTISVEGDSPEYINRRGALINADSELEVLELEFCQSIKNQLASYRGQHWYLIVNVKSTSKSMYDTYKVYPNSKHGYVFLRRHDVYVNKKLGERLVSHIMIN